MTKALVSMVTALADDELVIGHRHSEWTGFAPHIEEDVAFSSIAQDEIGHAAAYYALIASITGGNADAIALGREKDAYRNAILCERDNGDWAFTLVRHWMYDHADEIRLEVLAESKHAELAALVNKMRREERYHLIHAETWIKRVSHGPAEGRGKLVSAVADVYADSMGLFEEFEGEEEAVAEGWLPVASSDLRLRFTDQMTEAFDELGFSSQLGPHIESDSEFVASSSGDLIAGSNRSEQRLPDHDGSGGRRGLRSPEFEGLWADMTSTYRAHPGASW